MSTLEKQCITITLTGRAPVRVDPEQWGTIAQASDHDGAVECQAAHEWLLRVRRHTDGRIIVYGWERAGGGGRPAGYSPAYAGELLEAGADIPAAILRVAADCRCEDIAAECIADLPAVEVDASSERFLHGCRVTPQQLVDIVSGGDSREVLVREYPSVPVAAIDLALALVALAPEVG